VVAANADRGDGHERSWVRDSNDMKGSITLSAMRKTSLAARPVCRRMAGVASVMPDQMPDVPRDAVAKHRPHRASRTKALDGVPSQPHTFYIGVVNGGVWKTTDAGRTGRRSSIDSRPDRSARSRSRRPIPT
jgi:hypothetical protein